MVAVLSLVEELNLENFKVGENGWKERFGSRETRGILTARSLGVHLMLLEICRNMFGLASGDAYKLKTER